MCVPVSNLYTAMNSDPRTAPTESMYTEVSDGPNWHSFVNQGSKTTYSPMGQQKSFPPLPPIPSLLTPSTNSGKPIRQIIKSASLNCMLNDVVKRNVDKVSSADCLDAKEAEYDDIVPTKASGSNTTHQFGNQDEYQFMQKSADTTGLVVLGHKVQLLASKYTEVQSELQRNQQSLEECKQVISGLSESISSIQMQIASLLSSQSKRDHAEKDIEVTSMVESQENKALISVMSTEEVLHLLTILGLSQYKKKFQKERINGRFLLECDEDILKRELGITNKLHRMHLMMYITGKQSTREV